VHARFGPDVLKDGMDPLAFVRFLEKQGRLEGLRTDLSSLPTGEAFDPERCYLTLDFTIETKAEQKAIEDVFEFVKDTSEVRVTPVAASMAVAVAAPAVPAPLPSAPPPQRRPTPAARRAPSRSPPTSWTSWSTSSVSWSSPAPPRA
jgi:two-component system chemotaxis sensor kinase CheA